jgi:hypothetical protein
MNPEKKISFGNIVISQLSQNIGAFGTLPFSVEELTEINNTLKDKSRLYDLHGKVAKGNLNLAKKEWLRRFRVTAMHIDTLADGNGALISKSGFHLTKCESVPSRTPDRVNIDSMQGGREKGAVLACVKPLRDARGYLLGMMTNNVKVRTEGDRIVFEAGGELITLSVGSKRKVKFTGLPRLTSMKGIAAAFNRAGLGDLNTTRM